MDPLEGLPAPVGAPAQAIRAACAAWRGSGGGEAALLAAASAASAAFRALATATPDAGGLDEADAVDASVWYADTDADGHGTASVVNVRG